MSTQIRGDVDIKPLTITNAQIATAAAIAYSKLALSGSIVNADIVSLAWSKLTGTPTTLAGYGITSPLSVAQGGTAIASYVVGDLLYASATTTLSKLAAVAVGSVLVSGGVATAPAWSAAPSVDSVEVKGAGTARLRLRDGTTAGIGYWDLAASDFYNQGGTGVHNHTLGLHFNEDGALTTMPKWGENWEPRYVPAAAPNGLIEKNWDYTSIDGLTSYRPFNFNVNLNTHAAAMLWRVGTYSVLAAGDSPGSQDSFQVSTANKVISTAGSVIVGVVSGTAPYPFEVSGATRGTVAAAIRPTTVAADDVMLYINPANVTGQLKWIVAQSTVSDKATALFQNTGAGGASVEVLGGSSGDAWVRCLAGTDWSLGTDRSDAGKFKLTNNDTLGGSNDRLAVTAAGLFGFGVGSPTATIHLKAGSATANTAPLQFTSGAPETTARAGVVEFQTDDYFATITTGAARKAFVLDDGARLTSGKIPIATTNGRLVDGQTPLAGTKVYYVSDTSGGAVTRKLTFTNGILTAET